MFMHSRMLHSHTLMHTLQRDIGYGRMRVCAGKSERGSERERMEEEGGGGFTHQPKMGGGGGVTAHNLDENKIHSKWNNV